MPQNEKNYSVNTFSQTYDRVLECWFSLCGPTATTVGHSFRRQNLSMVLRVPVVVSSLVSSFWKVETHLSVICFFREISNALLCTRESEVVQKNIGTFTE